MGNPSKTILNIDDLKFEPFMVPAPPNLEDRFGARFAWIGAQVGAKKLGYNVTLVPPGKRAFPFHNHAANEEMFFILEGEGEIRIGEEKFPIRRGDIIACPPGGPETAHQIINTSTADLKYLAVSTKLSPEIADYPDSKKFGVMGEFPGADGKPRPLRFLGRQENSLGYWDGE